MLDLMRRHAGSWLIKVFLGAIIIVFSFWGIGSYNTSRANRVATVNGEPVSVEAYREAYSQVVERLRQQFGNQLDDAMLENFQVEQQALNQVIDARLLADEARRLHFAVTDRELVASITAIDAFRVNGRFDQQRYERLLNLNRTTPEAFEKNQRRALLLQKLQDWIDRSVTVSDSEAREFYNWQAARMKVDYVRFDFDRYTDLNPTDAELRSYFEDHRETYKTPPQVRVRYVHIDPAERMEGIAIPAEAVEEYYDAHPDAFFEPKKVEARHILFRLEPDAPSERVEAQRQKAADVLQQIREGADFAEMAKTHSEGPTGPDGGYLGLFRKEEMVAPFAEAAFSLEEGAVSEPVRTRFGWHLILVERIQPEGRKTLEEARESIRTRLQEDRAKTLAYEAAETFFDATFETNDLTAAAARTGNEVKETDWFTRSGPGEGVEEPGRFAAAAFGVDPGDISEVLELGGGYYVLQLVEKKEAEVPDFEAVKDRVREDRIEALKREKAREDAQQVLDRLASGEDWPAAVEPSGLEIRTTDWFRRNEAVPDLGREPQFTEAAFHLSAQRPYPEKPVESRQGVFLLRFADRELPDAEAFEEQKDSISRMLLRQKRTEAFHSMLAQLKERSEIVVEEAFRP